VPPDRRQRALRHDLEALIAAVDLPARLAHDPIAYPRRYRSVPDCEVAGLYAAFLAFGRVDLFRRTLDPWFAWLDAHGGPAAATLALDQADAAPILALQYRWVRGPDLIALMRAVGAALRAHGSLEGLLGPPGDVRARVDRAATWLLANSGAAPPSRALRHLIASPAKGSACKRWNLWLRWMVRPNVEGVDLGLWQTIAPSELIMPLDTHVLRTSRFLGLTARRDGSWRTAVEVTRALAELHPDDPVRYDFALAQLGISGACRGGRDPAICPGCPLDRLCRAPPAPPQADGSR